MKKLLLLLAGVSLSGSVLAAGGHALPYTYTPDGGNEASLQRGARNFMNYCSGCHSMKHLRYSRIGQDLGIPEDLMKSSLMFTSDKVGDPIKSSLSTEQGVAWFGQAPPDLSVKTRERGADWVYNFLMTFYLDPKKPTGVNNLVLAGASMPHVLGDLQGWQAQVLKDVEKVIEEKDSTGKTVKKTITVKEHDRFDLSTPGKLSADEYKKFVADTVNFMAYAAEPGKAKRISTGIKVMIYLFIFTIFAYLLKKEYWKDVH